MLAYGRCESCLNYGKCYICGECEEGSAYKADIKALWEDFCNVPMNPETEEIEFDWNDFPVGTHREEIWHWFEETFHISIEEDLM